MKVFIAGGTGVIGRQLVPRLVAEGYIVTAISRSDAGVGWLRDQGALAELCDVFDAARLQRLVAQCRPDAVMHQMTDISPNMHPRRVGEDMSTTNRLRTEGTRLLANAATSSGARRFIVQSIAFLYAPDHPSPASERTPLYREAPAAYRPMVDAVTQCEEVTLGTAGIEGTVLRYGYFYGAGTIYARDGTFANGVMQRRIPLVGDGAGVYSFIHVSDAAAATVAALQADAGIYNVVDDEPAAVREWLPCYASVLGARPPVRIPALIGRMAGGSYLTYLMNRQIGASNLLAKSHLGWRPRYASWREGFKSEFASSDDIARVDKPSGVKA